MKTSSSSPWPGHAVLAAALALLPFPQVCATVVWDSFDPGGSFHPQFNAAAATVDTSIGTNALRAAAQFVVSSGNFNLASITLPISFQGNAPGNLRVRLTTDAGGVPGATLEVLSENQNIWPGFSNPFTTSTTLSSTSFPALFNGQKYWIVTEPTSIPATPNSTAQYQWFENANGFSVLFRQQGGAALPVDPWTGNAVSNNVAFRVDGSVNTNPVPAIIGQPVSQTVSNGGMAGFSVFASGVSPLSYQWLANNVPVPGATNASLSIGPVKVDSAGAFAVVVTDSFGSVTSAPAILAVIHDFHIWLVDTNSMPAARSAIEQRGGLIQEYSEYFQRISFTSDTAQFAEIAVLPSVRRAEVALEAALFNHNSRVAIGTINIQPPPYGTSVDGLTGAGVTAGVWDGGTLGLIHPDFAARVIPMDTCLQPTVDYYNHAAHVTGTMAGDGSLIPRTYAGMAPGETIRAWSFLTCNGQTPQTEMKNARYPIPTIDYSQNSWGYVPDPCTVYGAYVGFCEEYDRLVREHSLPIFFAAGNSQDGQLYESQGPCPGIVGGFGTVLPIGTAKNVVTVGAIDILSQLTTFSSCGPTLDGRVKPDVVALGLSVFSTVGTTYGFKSGTSMATPAVSGTSALLIQQFRMSYGTDPSPALLKAILCGTATDLGNAGPDFKYGYGKVNAVTAVETIVDQNFQDVSAGLNTDGTWTKQISATAGCELRILLAWTDAEYKGTSSSAPTLVNDLDLTVTEPNGTTIHYPLTLNPNSPNAAAVEGPNHRDNVEEIVVANPTTGQWTIQVKGFNVPQGPQPFAVVWNSTCPVPPCASGSSQPIQGLFNTGEGIVDRDANGDPIEGSEDPNYKLISSPIGTTFTLAIVRPSGDCVPANNCGGPGGSWLPGGQDSSGDFSWWLHPGPVVAGDPATTETWGDYIYETTFDLGCCDPGTANLGLFYTVDDAADMILNGTPVPNGQALGGYVTFTPVQITSDPVKPIFCRGINHLRFVVHNNGGAPTGLRVKWDLPNCTVCCPSGASIAGQMFSDLNGNGLHDPDEPGMPYQVIHLSNGKSTVTDINGAYVFQGLPQGTYVVSEALSAGSTQTAPAGGSYTVNLVTDECAEDRDFGNRICSIECPADIVVDCTNELENIVYYPPSSLPGVTYDPPSGSSFHQGTTPVTCTAIDPCGVTQTCVFNVTVHRAGNLYGRWIKSNCNPIDDSAPTTRANAIAVDLDGNSFVGGTFSGVARFSTPANHCDITLTADGATDGFLAKYDADGTLLWVRQIIGPGDEGVNGVAADSHGNCYVVGSFDGGTVGFPQFPGVLFYAPLFGFGGSDIFLAKYAPNGNPLWSSLAGGEGGDSGEGVAVDDNDDCYITGGFTKDITFGNDTTAVPIHLAEDGSSACYLAKCSSGGSFLWAIANSHNYGSHGDFGATAHSVAIDSKRKKAFVTGTYHSQQLDTVIYFTGSLKPTHGANDPAWGRAFVAQADIGTTPAWTWAREVYCPGGYCDSCDATGICVDKNNGHCFFTGYFHGSATIGTGLAIGNPSASAYNTMVGSLTTGGDVLWFQNVGNNGDDEPRGVAVDQGSGELYVTGFEKGLDVNADGGRNVKLLKLDPSTGQKISTLIAPGISPTADNAGRGIAVGIDGCVYVAGSYKDRQLIFNNFVDGIHVFGLNGITKLFVARYCSSCSTQCEPPIITNPLKNALVTTGPSLAHPIDFTVTASGTVPLMFNWFRNNVLLPAPSGMGYTIDVSPDGLTGTLHLTGVPVLGSGSTYSVGVGSFCCACTSPTSAASIFYFGGGNPTNGIAPYRQLQINAGAGVPYTVEYRDDLNPDAPWQFLTNIVGSGTNGVIIDPNPNPFMRFYRIPLEPEE